ncbi:serine/threonine protein kinase [Catovirus CTV1]|uniref:Serine/threonine protein kinase n=1 Tax=Catovirus CTV1 TaxID=1977631 RepID=A0A1V0SBL5_9VIRU|nr:serine/threonine protein kinase [Catovirus CTV1]
MSEKQDSNISNGSYGQVIMKDNNTVIKSTQKFNSNNDYYRQNIQEAVFLSTVVHNHIVKTNKVYLENNQIKIEQEKGEQTLHDYINKTDRGERIVHMKHIFFQLIKVLFFLHKNGYIHGDLKPNNILLSTVDMSVKLIDFGGICSFRLNNNHKSICTPSFCPPEGWKQLNMNCLNSKFDVWSLAMTMYFYITRSYLLDFEDDRTICYVNEFKWSFSKYHHHNIDALKDIIDDGAFVILQKMLMYDPDDRISSDEIYFDEYFSEYEKEQIPKIQYESKFDSTFMQNYTVNEWKQRSNLIDWVYDICVKNEVCGYLVLCVWIIDNYLNKIKKRITSGNIKLLGASSLIICSILLAKKSFNYDCLSEYLPRRMTRSRVQKSVDDIMEKLNFKLYVPTFDLILKTNIKGLDYSKIIKILKEKKYIGVDQNNLWKLYE